MKYSTSWFGGAFALPLLVAAPGCVSSNHQLASRKSSPAVAINLPGRPSTPVDAKLESVIVYDGPGSWKRRAFWDEYVVTVDNRSRLPITLTGAYLIDGDGNRISPGSDWQQLERQSADWWKRNATPENFALGAGQTVIAVGAGTGLVVAFAGLLGASLPAVGVGLASALVFGGAAHLLEKPDQDGQRLITEEFNRRQLALHAPVTAGDLAHGSLFFQVTPSPRELWLHYKVADQTHRVAIDLAPLIGLHRRNHPPAGPQPVHATVALDEHPPAPVGR
ncbi:MAG: hypothetical protein FJ399_04330 [Verrucomicrobia bacterium]|nr:hypothetical protein [Verrucomicrobiota bacterium]